MKAQPVLLMFVAAAFLTGASPARAEEPDPAQVAAARGAVKSLGEALREQLVAALKAGGPVAALGVCKTIAPDLAAEMSAAAGLDIGRTALKVRNPGNAADAYEQHVLEEFVAKISAGADPSQLEHAAVVTEEGKQVLRYLKPIPMAAEPCGACHGSDLKPEVKAEIERLYPADQAVGFKPGELRGAFTVRRVLSR